MEKIELIAEIRMGDEKIKDIKNLKMVPAVVYGHSQEAISLKITQSDMLKTYRKAGESHIVYLKAGKKTLEVLIRECQKNPVTGEFIHVDFYAITKGEKLTAHIHLNFIGNAPAKKEGAIIEEHIKSIEVKCLPNDLIDAFDVDLSKLLSFGDAIRIADLNIDTSKYEVLLHTDEIIVSAAKPKVVTIEEEANETSADASEGETEKDTKEEK